MSNGLGDARGVPITAGDVAIWGFGVDRSVAMAEGVVMREKEGYPYPAQTPTGRIKIRVTRRSFNSGEKPVVDVAPDRLVVLKWPINYGDPGALPMLPESPLPTQAEKARTVIEARIKHHTEELRAKVVPHWWERMPFPVAPMDAERVALVEYLAWHNKELAKQRRKLRELDEPLP